MTENQAMPPSAAEPKAHPRLDRMKKNVLAFLKKNYHLLLCFFIPFALMGLAYTIIGTWPFGKESVLVLDLNGQYVYFFEGLRDMVYGNASVLYSFSRSMGGEFMGMYAYYLASPLSYLVALYPKEAITEALYLMFLLKCGSCGLTMGIYLEKIVGTKRTTTMMFSTLYAMCAYAVVMQHNTMWTDNIILLPVIAMGLEAMIRYRKYKLYTVALTVAVLSNFYIGYMTCIFVVLYCLYAYFGKTREERNPLKEKHHFLRAFSQVLLFSIIAVLISSLIWIPTYYSLEFGKNSFDSGMTNDDYYNFFAQFNIFELFPKLFFGSYDTVDRPGMPMLYCGTLPLLTIPFYFVKRDVHIRQKLSIALISLVLAFSFCINTLDKVWHGFQEPNWLNFRYAFMLVFLLLIMAAKGYEDIVRHSPRAVLLIAAVLAFLLCLSESFGNEHISFLLMVGPSLAFLALAAGVLVFTIRRKRTESPRKPIRMRVTNILAMVLVFGEITLSAVGNLGMLNMDVTISDRSSYRNFIDTWQPAVDYVKEMDHGFYRMEKTSMRKYNDPFGLGYRGLSGSTSTLNADTLNFLYNMGLGARSHLSAYQRPMPVSDSLLSVKYMLAPEDGRMTGYYNYVTTVGDVDIYENPYALPIAYCVNSSIRKLTFTDPTTLETPPLEEKQYVDTNHPCARFNAMISAMVGEETEIMIPAKGEYAYKEKTENLQRVSYGSYYRYNVKNKGEKATITYTFMGKGEDEIFFYVPIHRNSSSYLKQTRLYIDGEKKSIGYYFSNNSHCVYDLGAFADGEKHTLTIEFKEDYAYFGKSDCYFYYLDTDVYQSVFTELSEGGYRIDSHTEDAFQGNITVPEGKTTVFTTIAFDKGWHVYIDGKEVDTYENLDALLAFDAPEGEHKLELRYFPDCYKTAIKLACIGSGLFVAIIATELIYRRFKKKTVGVSQEETATKTE